MKSAAYTEYKEAKQAVLNGVEYKEQSTMEGNTTTKTYTTESGCFYERMNMDASIVEFWSNLQPESKFYDDSIIESSMAEELENKAVKTSENTFLITLENGAIIAITKGIDYNGHVWPWKIDTQIFSSDTSAKKYLDGLTAEKLTGNRIIRHEKQAVPAMCGNIEFIEKHNRTGDGWGCRADTRKAFSRMCDGCPVAEKMQADRDGVKLVYI